ncbi:MAG: serine hydrolase domain-containing protein [Pseudomonadota bacterium]
MEDKLRHVLRSLKLRRAHTQRSCQDTAYAWRHTCGAVYASLRSFVGSVFLLASISVGASGLTEIDTILREEHLPGIAWVSIHGEDSQATGNGFADLASSSPMTATTKVQVGSVTKTLVALGVLHLVTSERISLDDNVQNALPELNWDNPWTETPITVQHLLEHTAGLDNLRMWQFLNSRVTEDTPLSAAFPPDFDHLLKVRTRPGTQYSYSNIGYALLGMIIERVTADRYEDFLQHALLNPLEMNDSSFHFISQQSDARLAMGYVDDGVEQIAVPMFLRSAGQFTTTANDMQIFLEFLLGDGNNGGSSWVAPEYLQRLGTPSTTDAYAHGLHVGHGLALGLRDRHGALGECHPGTTFGFRAQLCVFPKQRKGFFYAVNADNEQSNYERLTSHFINGLQIAPGEKQLPRSSENLDRYRGLYRLSPSNMAQFAWLDWMFNSVWVGIDEDRERLVIRSLQAPDKTLRPLGNGLFRENGRLQASHVIYGDSTLKLSNGLMTWARASMLTLALAWISLVAGACGLLYITLRGGWLFFTGRLRKHTAVLIPWLSLIAFALPVYLYTTQSFLQFGELTAASAVLAALTGALPIALGTGVYLIAQGGNATRIDLYAVVAGFQLCSILVVLGVLPVVFWR